ncbi:MAG: hypothetical protein AB1384_12785, partial [Actinomycetota bacterium]
MKKMLVVLALLVLCLVNTAALAAWDAAGRAGTVGAGAVAADLGSYAPVFSESYLKSLPQSGGHYTCSKASDPFTYFEQDWKGVDLYYLLVQEVGIVEGTTGFKVQAADGYGVTLTWEELRGNGNPRGLKTLLGYLRSDPSADNPNAPDGSGAPWVASVEPAIELDSSFEGPFRLIMPQEVEGPYSGNISYTSPPGNGTPNWDRANRLVRAIEVLPLPAGVTELTNPELAALPDDEIVVYGNVHPNLTITASAGAGGSITPSGAVMVNYEGSKAFAIAPAEGYEVADVLVDGASVGAVTACEFTGVTDDHTIHASFVPTAGYRFFFAEGYTGAGLFDEYLCLMNPGDTPTTAHITYMFPDGTTQP